MNWVDLLLIIVAGLGGLIGWRMGLLGAIFNTIGLVVGVFIATQFSDDLASWFTEQNFSDTIATVSSYLVIIISVFFVAQVARNFTKKVLNLVFLTWVDTLGSIGVGLLFGFALSGALIMGLARYSNDIPDEVPIRTSMALTEITGFRRSIQDSMVDSTFVPLFIDITNAIPGSSLGFVSGDFARALKLLEQRIES